MDGQSIGIALNTRACRESDREEGAEDDEGDEDAESDYDDSGYYDDVEGNTAGTHQDLFSGVSGVSGDSAAPSFEQFLELLFQLCIILSTEPFLNG
jgi:hypothetical protein